MANISITRDDYTVGWICATPLEMAAAKLMLDYEIQATLPKQLVDDNAYLFGRIKEHNVVIACLPDGVYGIASAATVAVQLLSSFPMIRFGLMVGIGGGVPKKDADIRLGDIVVSGPTRTFGGVVQHDHGKALSGGGFERTGMLNLPPLCLLTAVSKLKSHHLTEESRVPAFLAEAMRKLSPKKATTFTRPVQEDRLFLSDYEHSGNFAEPCDTCDITQTVSRVSREDNDPVIHYGLIASGSQVMKDSQLRDKLGREMDVHCIEMEAAGLMNANKFLVIRGICDYADSHKNDIWQGYAAVTAAAYAKELLHEVSGAESMNASAMTNDSSPPIFIQDIRYLALDQSNPDRLGSIASSESDYGDQQWDNVIRARERNGECRNCGRRYHYEKNCLLDCGRCGDAHHTQNECPNPVTCYKCGGQNHMARDCA